MRITSTLRNRLLPLVLLGLPACTPSLTGNEPREVNKAMPASFGEAGTSTSIAQKKFSEIFSPPELRGLIDAALKNNRELNAQLQEIIITQNEISARQGDYLPKVNAQAGAGVEKVGERTSQGVSDEAHGVPAHLGDFKFGLAASWEVDVWGKLRNAAKAARLRYLASLEARNFMVTQIVAEIARSYYELLAVDNELDVLKKNIQIQTDALEIINLQKQAARVTGLAVQRFEAEVFKNKSRLYDVEQERVQLENRINFLVGRFPQPIARNPEEFKEPLPDDIQTGLPSQLLENRPDLRQAELELEAAKLDVKSARAAFYPALSIEAGAGYRSFNAEHLVATPESLVYNVAGNLTAPLLNRAAINAQYRSANARQLQAVYNYEKTLLQAFTDVANRLSKIANLKQRYDFRAKQVDALAQSVEVSKLLFQSARADYMEVLLTRRDSLDAELELIETKLRQFEALVDIYQALGGGWRTDAR
jgi:outer membrane protein, multidrug efflux system